MFSVCKRNQIKKYLSALVSEELSGIVDDLFICQVGVRLLLTNTQHLPQSDPKRPHVTGCGELTLAIHTNNIIQVLACVKVKCFLSIFQTILIYAT